MAASIVARGAVGLRKEASFASGGAIDSWQVIESANVVATNQFIFQDRIRNTPEQIGGSFSHVLVAGSIVFPVSPANPTQWWQCGVGGTGPYTPSRPLSSMAFEIQEGDIAAVYTSGDMISRLQFSSKQGDILRCTAQIEGKNINARVTPSTVSFSSGDDPYLHSECQFTLDSVVNSQVTAFDVSIDNNLVTDLIANNRARRDILATKAVVTGSISILFEGTTFRDRFMNTLPSAITALYQRGGRSIKLELLNIVYDSSDRNMASQTAYIVETLTFTAFVNDTSAQNSLKITVV